MARFIFQITTNNAAFGDNPDGEVARLLREAANQVVTNKYSGVCVDANGNKVGDWTYQH